MHGHGIPHLDEYKRSQNKSITYAFQLDGVFVKRRSVPRTKDLRLHRLAILRLDFSGSRIVHYDPPSLYALGD